MSWVVVEETVRRHGRNVGVVAFLLVLAMFGFTGAIASRPAAAWPTFVTIFAIVTGCAIIGPEFSSGTLQLILVKPINRAVYLVSRVMGVLLVVWFAALLGFACEAAARAYAETVPWKPLGVALLNSMISSTLVVALLAFLGSLTRAYFNVAAFWALQILLGGLLALQRKLPSSVVAALNFLQRNLFPDTPARIDRDWMLLVLGNAAIVLVLGCVAFCRREVPYGAD